MYEVFISGSLIDSKSLKKQKKFYEEIAEVCEECGFGAYVPHQHTDPKKHPNISPEMVYKRNYEIIANAKFVISFVDTASFGVGTEVEIAKNNNTKVILMYHNDKSFGRMLLGNPAVKHAIRYKTKQDAFDKLKKILGSSNPKH